MYIKLSFQEEFCLVPGSWEGDVIMLKGDPKIIDTLPENIVANKSVNENSQNNDDTKCFDYYLDCESMTHERVKRAIKLFSQSYQFQQPGALAEDFDWNNNRHPSTELREGNAVIRRMQNALDKVKNSMQLISPDSPRWGLQLFKTPSPLLVEESNFCDDNWENTSNCSF